ncbi:hypothetical protein [Aquimarina mytili]|uniref:Uncharacterized protein n=1 Tax=Aquimarina mytili TaxID=874423 RepID=A0A936ZZ69_9FLAO|nr:hypothetical protein [Aquimarina mytili]MBL0683851.1 hypothetical protein [Aquimarina mytili]
MESIKFLIDDRCCKDEGGNGDNGDKNCLTKWEDDFIDACNTYKRKSAEADKRKEKYTNSYNWKDKLDKWFDLIEKSDEKASDIVVNLDFFYQQVLKVCKNSKCTNGALRKLLCLVKSMFDCLYTYEQSKKGLFELTSELITAIECLKNLKDEDKDEMIKCIKVYEEKIKAIAELQDAIITKLLDSLKCANLLYAYICEEHGLEYKLKKMLDEFKGDLKEKMHCSPDEDDDKNMYPCDDEKAKPQPEFPIRDSEYFKEIQKALGIAVIKTEQFKKEWTDKKKESDEALSRKNSLTEAIKAAKAAEGK